MQKALGVLIAAEAHDAFNAGAVVPAAVEYDDFPPRQVGQIPLNVHLRFFPLGGGGKGHHAENPRAHPGGDGLDRAALAGAVSSLKDDAYFLALVPHPFLKLDQLHVQSCKLLS